MTKNVGRTERIIRILLGIGILSLAFVRPQPPWVQNVTLFLEGQ